jgi:hypothetical protein
MDPHNTFFFSHFLERVDGNWLTGGSVRSECVCGSWDPMALGGQKEGRREGWKEGWGKGRKEGRGRQLNNGSSSLIRWRLVNRVKRRESFRVRRGFRRGFGCF